MFEPPFEPCDPVFEPVNAVVGLLSVRYRLSPSLLFGLELPLGVVQLLLQLCDPGLQSRSAQQPV